MRLLQIFDQTTPLVSGYSMRSRYITESLVKLGIDVDVVSSPIFQYKQDSDSIGGAQYRRTQIEKWNIVRKFPIFREYKIVKALEGFLLKSWNEKINVIDAHSSVLNGIAAAKIAKEKGVPFIYEIRAFWEDAAVDQGKTKEGSPRYKLTRAIETDVVKKADKVTVICEGLKNDLIERDIDPRKITVIPNGVDTEKFRPVKTHQGLLDRYELNDVKVIGFIGTFFEFEGLDLLVRAAKNILSKRKDVKFLLVGGGRHEQYLMKRIHETGMQKHFIFTGRVAHDQILDYYSVIDILVYPRISKRITELVTPLKPLEAMALEKVVIGSDVGGIKELIRDGENGLLFRAGSFGDLAAKCVYVLNHLDEMQEIARAARKYVVKERNWLKICEQYLPIYKELGVNV